MSRGLIAAGVLFIGLGCGGNGEPEASGRTESPQRRQIREFWAHYRAATAARIAGDIEIATDAYREALARNPDHEDALYYFGNMQLQLGAFAEAETAWRQLVTHNPMSGRAHSRLGVLYLCLDREDPPELDRARQEFDRARELNREDTGPLLQLGEVALLTGDARGAARFFEDALGSNHSSVEARFYLGFIAWRRGDSDPARRWFDDAVTTAQPTAPAAGVSGEGDTKEGLGPMVANVELCRHLEEPMDGLRTVEPASIDSEMQARYRALDAVLRRYSEVS